MIRRSSLGILKLNRSALMARSKLLLATRFAATAARDEHDVKHYVNPPHETTQHFKEHEREQRKHNAGPDYGIKPTAFQKKFLVITGLYDRAREIPEYVPHGTFDKLQDRIRAIVIVTAVLSFVSLLMIRNSLRAEIARERSNFVLVPGGEGTTEK